MDHTKGSTQSISRDVVMEPFWAIKPSEVFVLLDTSSNGLTAEEVAARKGTFGVNAIKENARLSKATIIFHQMQSPLIIILIIAGFINIFLREWVEVGVIFLTVIANTAFGFWQENKAETVLDLLKTYVRVRTRVTRGGQEHDIDAAELVPGDMIRIERGNRVPADCRLVFVNGFSVDESVLTGESLPVRKQTTELAGATNPADKTSMAFSGTLVLEGFADAVVTATGTDTEFGKIAALIGGERREQTPLQRSIGEFAKYAGLLIVLFTVLLFGVGMYVGRDLYEMFLIAIAVAVSAVPEGLPIALTMILAIGVERLARQKGIVRRLIAAEALGSVSMILTDKTGTLTEAKMKLVGLAPREPGVQYEHELLEAALLNTDVVIENPAEPHGNWRVSGAPIEVALVRGAAERGVKYDQMKGKTSIFDRLPFSSQHKFSVTASGTRESARLVVMGAPEIILRYTALSGQEQKKLADDISRRAHSGERVVGVAVAENIDAKEELIHEKKFSGLRFLGLLSFRDPLRPHAALAIRDIAAAGVKTIIVTGDHPGTAESVARELGMLESGGSVLTGDDLRYFSKEELTIRAPETVVYARVTPEQKMMLVKLYQELGEVVAVTGDGVNDAPALAAATIGIAVGSGSDVAKQTADLVILDDDFGTVVDAIKSGRSMLLKIKKVIIYLLSNSFDEVFLIGGALLMGVALPITALQILFVNLFSDSLPAIAFAFEEGVDGAGNRPMNVGKGIFDLRMKFFILGIGVVTSALLFVLYMLLLSRGIPHELVRTFIFASFASYTLLYAFSLRSLQKSIFEYNPFSNMYLTTGVAIGLVLIAAAIYFPPLGAVLGTHPLPLYWLFGVLGIGLFNMCLAECGKWLFRTS